ncbi:hypothetical protein GCM10023194_76560 [Planotetraspora phitsanulokensis]|uniref:Lipoprotein n=1 Tax=Planotetraspora phitsanulokensis TaxID=575192 RepID=A0A8J3TZ99_9ACTN|nr:hypothetical protein [Planotetraspora phitsanulokensis]GII35470.1 hypothetical protein Pph01_04730 [Planotetraspora phitsanulokensis]
MTRFTLGSALAVTALTIALTACQSTPHDSSAESASPAGTGGTSTDEAVYVTGAKPGDDACTRVVSAIGYLELSLLPAGQEDAQRYDGDVRGRFGYVRGTLAMYGPHLPASLAGPAATIEEVGTPLSAAATDPAQRPALLREYRQASHAITSTCPRP